MSTESPRPGAPITVSTQTDSNSTSEIDRKLKELDLEKKRAEVDAQRDWWARWNNPLILAIVAAIIGYLSSLLTSYLNRTVERERNEATIALEQKKFEGTLILDAIKTGDGADHERRAAANLLFLAESKLIKLDDSARKKLKDVAKDTPPGLPSTTAPASSTTSVPVPIGTLIAKATPMGEAHVTLGCLVVADGRLCLLTTNVFTEPIKLGDLITLPGGGDGLSALVTRQFDLSTGNGIGMLAAIQRGKVSAASHSFKLDPNPAEPALGMDVMMEGGRSQKVKRGRISKIDVTQVMPIEAIQKQVAFKGLFFIETNDGLPFWQPGDVGAIVVEAKSRRPVGMLVAGGENDGVAIKMSTLVDELKITRILSDGP